MKWKFNAYLLWPLGKSVKINKCRAFVHSEYKKMYRGKINGKAGKAAALPKFSYMLTLSKSRGADYAQPLALPHLKFFLITLLRLVYYITIGLTGVAIYSYLLMEPITCHGMRGRAKISADELTTSCEAHGSTF